jgi:hypothetical protein
MLQRREDHFQILPRTPGTAGQVDDESLSADPGNGPGKHGMGGLVQACRSHGLYHPWDLPLDYSQRGVGRKVSGADSGAAGGNYQIKARFVSQGSEALLNEVLVVGQYLIMADGKPGPAQDFLNHRAALVLPLTTRSSITDGEDCSSSHNSPLKKFSKSLAQIFHELMSRDLEDGCATGQPQGVGSEAYLNGTSQESTPEDARKGGHVRGRSKPFMKHPG